MRSLIYYPDKLLQTPCTAVTDFSVLLPLVEEMNRIMIAAEGVGLAAPQVGELLRLIIVREGSSDKYTVYVNPEVTEFSKKKTATEEGCLSIPGVYGYVERSAKVRIKYQTLEGKWMQKKATGFEAIVLQHEIDHTNGILILDRPFEVTRGQELLQNG